MHLPSFQLLERLDLKKKKSHGDGVVGPIHQQSPFLPYSALHVEFNNKRATFLSPVEAHSDTSEH